MAVGAARGESSLSDFTIKDSGARESFDSGMVRDTEDGKVDYSLVLDGPMFKRWAAHLTKGAQKYAPRNWMKATGEAEYERFKRSFLRHAVAYLEGARDEDHAAAMIFNINGMEYVRDYRDSVAEAAAILDSQPVVTAPLGTFKKLTTQIAGSAPNVATTTALPFTGLLRCPIVAHYGLTATGVSPWQQCTLQQGHTGTHVY